MTKQLTPEDIERAFAEVGGKDRTRCIVGRVIDTYPALEKKIMDVEHFSAPTVHRVLKALSIEEPPSTESILKHRRGTCRCTKEK